jgi:hypothetical protein
MCRVVALPTAFHQTVTTAEAYYQRVLIAFRNAKTRQQFIDEANKIADALLKESGKIK